LSIFTSALRTYYDLERGKFLKSLQEIEETQRTRLDEILSGLPISKYKSYENFVQNVPLLSESDWQVRVAAQRAGSQALICNPADIKRFEPTSGSTGERKWVPYTTGFLKELNRAAAAWMADVFREHPRTLNGRFYWSLSWLPEQLRRESVTDDSDLFPWWQSLLLKQIFAVSPAVALSKTAEEAWTKTLLSLMKASDLSLISVWSPTFILRVWEDLGTRWNELLKLLPPGERKELPHSRPSSPLELWPRLALVSCWDTSSSALWANQVRTIFKGVPVQGKGLWATEGVVTFPFQGLHRLAVRSHFYEFRDFKTQNIFPSWQLRHGMEVQPILTTSSGFLRYPLNDRLEVIENDCAGPALKFLGRNSGVDLVGEKIDEPVARRIVELLQKLGYEALCLIAVHRPNPRYVIVIANNLAESEATELGLKVENELLKTHHYQLARELGQLQIAKAIFTENALHFQEKLFKNKILGQNKPEFLCQINDLQFLC